MAVDEDRWVFGFWGRWFAFAAGKPALEFGAVLEGGVGEGFCDQAVWDGQVFADSGEADQGHGSDGAVGYCAGYAFCLLMGWDGYIQQRRHVRLVRAPVHNADYGAFGGANCRD